MTSSIVGQHTIESCKIRTLYTPQDPDTAQWISEALGPKTEVHQQTTYTGHRLAFWLGHVMVADQESARPHLDAAELCKLPAEESIILVAGFAPFRARRLKFFERPEFAERAKLPALELPPSRPYPFRPRPRMSAWAGGVCARAPANVASSTAASVPRDASFVATTRGGLASRPPRESEGWAIDEEGLDATSGRDDDAQAGVQQRLRGLDELERLERAHARSAHQSISL